MTAVSAIAVHTPFWYILFPELAALSFELFSHPRGRWAEKPWAVAASPAAAGALGVLVSRTLGFSPFSVALTVAGTMAILALLRSAVAPALSAGLLAVVLEVKDPLYPVAILAGALILLAAFALYVRRLPPDAAPSPRPGPDGAAGPRRDSRETGPRPNGEGRRVRLREELLVRSLVVAFAVAVAYLARETGLRFLLFPPLVVLTFEMFHNPGCPWVRDPARMAMACLLTASFGYAVRAFLGLSPAAVALAVAGGTGILAAIDLHVPPALAVGLLPFVIHEPTWAYPVAVGAGAALSTLYFLAWRHVRKPRPAITGHQPPRPAAG